MKIVVYTAIFGNIDRLWSVHPPTARGAEFVCFTDQPRRQVGLWDDRRLMLDTGRMSAMPLWDVRVVKAQFGPRRTARYYKTMAHQHFPDADISIWVDGNVRIRNRPGEIVKWLRGGDLAIFKHPDRDCLYDEAAFCAKKGKDRRAILNKQVALYHKEGMPRHWGLPETRCVIRRHTPLIADLNRMWWTQIKTFSVRDQVSIPYVCWKLGIRWQIIRGRCWPRNNHPGFFYIKHKV